MQDKLRVAAYCRVSTDKDDQVNSLNSQCQYFADYINNHDDWRLVRIYFDEGASGTSTKKRKDFNNMIADAKARRIDLILTKEISRFARNTLDSIQYTRELKSAGVGVIFINDNINTLDPDSELRLAIMSSIAQEESRKTSERVKWGQRRRMEQGVVFGRDLLGYFVRDGNLVINHDEADAVKLIYHKFLNEGKGTHVISRELSEAGIRPKRAKQWSNVTILRVLRNEKYCGDLLQMKTYTPDYLTHEKKYNRGAEDVVYLKDHHEPIIDRKTWDRAQAELARRSPSNEQRSKYSNRYWCSGKLVCGECGQRFVSRTKRLTNGMQYKAWRCYAAATHGLAKTDAFGNDIGCDSHSINDKTLLACVEHVLNFIRVNKEDIVKDLLRDIKAVLSSVKKVDTTTLYAKIDNINNKKTKAIDSHLEGTISVNDLKLINEMYDLEITELKNMIFEAEDMNGARRLQAENIQNCITEIKKMVNINIDVNNEALYRELIESIGIFNGNIVDVYLKHVPFGIRLSYSTDGKMDKYKVEIGSMEIAVKEPEARIQESE